MLEIVPCLLVNDSLHHKRGCFVQSFQNLLALFVQHIVYASVIDVAGTHLYGSVNSCIVNQRKQTVQTALDGSGVVIELEKVGWLPVKDFLLARYEATDEFSLGQSVQHVLISMNVLGTQFIQNHHNINVAALCCFTTAIAAL